MYWLRVPFQKPSRLGSFHMPQYFIRSIYLLTTSYTKSYQYWLSVGGYACQPSSLSLWPEAHVGDVTGDLSARRAQIEGIEARPGGIQAIRAMVPLAEMFGYATELRSMTQGRGAFTMEFDHYQEVERSVSEKILVGVR